MAVSVNDSAPSLLITEEEQKESVVTRSCHVGDVFLCHVCHEADNGEDHKASEHAGARVDAAHDDRVSGGGI